LNNLSCGSSSFVVEMLGVVKEFKRGPRIGPITLHVKRGEVFAIIGPNGAGKTTTLRLMAGIYKPNAGVVRICGRVEGFRSLVFYVPEETAVYSRLKGREVLYFYALLYAGDRREADIIARKAWQYSGLEGDVLERRVGDYSKGMKRRLLLGLAMAINTPLLVLDEPTSGLDVYTAVHVRRLIRREADRGRAVVVTSHNMFEVEKIADKVAFLNNGVIVDVAPPNALLARYDAKDLEEAFIKAVRTVVERGVW